MSSLNFRVSESLVERCETVKADLVAKHGLETTNSDIYRTAITTFLQACETVMDDKKLYDITDIQLAIVKALNQKF